MSISASQTSGCAPLAIQFQSQVTGCNGQVAYLWNFGNGNTSNQANPVAFYNTVGTYNVTLTVTCGGQTATATLSGIQVNVGPQSSFTAIPVYDACGQQSIQFTATAVPGNAPITSYQWLMGDGTTQNLQSFSYTYSTPGTFGVTLVVTSSDGCQSFYSQNVVAVVNPPNVVANFQAPVTNSCQTPFQVTFQNLSTAPAGTQFFWNFGNGQTSTQVNPTVTYNAVGAYSVTLVAIDPQSGCVDTHYIPNYITVTPVATAGFQLSSTSVCPGQQIQTVNQSGPVGSSFLWNFGNGQSSTQSNPTFSYNNPGNYTVTLQVTNGNCTATASANVTVHPNPDANFTVNPTSSCQLPATFSFTNTSVGASSYLWHFGGASPNSTQAAPTITVNSYGNYNVRLIATNQYGCKDTLFIPNLLQVQPLEISVSSSISSACSVPQTVTFSATSNLNNQPLVSYLWTFSNGTTSTAANPTVIITTAGPFGATLVASTAQGCVDTVSEDHLVNIGVGQVNPSFTMNPTVVCAGYPVSFTNTSVGGSFFTWLANGQVFSTEINPSQIFYYPDTFEIALVGTAEDCPGDTSPVQILIVKPSSAIFKIDRTCDGSNTVKFHSFDQSATSLWLYPGDGSVVNVLGLSSYTHTYAPNANYVSYVISSNAVTGCVDTFKRSFFVRQFALDFNYSPQGGCAPLDVTFTSATQGFTSVRWFFGNGQFTNSIPINANNPVSTVTTTYANTGNYLPYLVGSFNFGSGNICRDTVFKPVIVSPKPLAQASVAGYSGCGPVTVHFQSNVSPGASILWDFGDGTTSTLANPSHTFQNFDNNVVVLKATIGQCTNVDSLVGYELYPGAPQAQIDVAPTAACPWTPVSFAAFVSGTYSSMSWDFGDNTGINSPAGFHTYHQTGNFQPYFKITDINGCEFEIPAPLVSITQPTAQFHFPPVEQVCPPVIVNFNDASINAVAYLWDFDNGATSSQINPATTYFLPGNYQPVLVVWDANGCTDTATVETGSLSVAGPVLDSLKISDTAPCPGQVVHFDIFSPNATLYVLNTGQGGLYLVGENTNYQYPQTGTYHPFVTLGTQVGNEFCLVNFPPQEIVVAPLDIQVSFPNPTCYGTGVSIMVEGADTYQWEPASSFPLGTVTNTGNNLAFPSATGYVYITGTDVYGCQDTDSLWLDVLPKPSAQFSFTDKCVFSAYQFQNQSTSLQPIISYQWNFNNLGLSTDENPQFVFTDPNPQWVSLIVTTHQGCSDTAIHFVHPFPKPQADFSISGFCSDYPTFIHNTSSVNSPSYINSVYWIVDNQFLNITFDTLSNDGSPISLYLDPGQHIVSLVAQSNHGCLDTTIQTLTIHPTPEAAFSLQNPVSCTGEPIWVTDVSTFSSESGTLTWYINSSAGTEIFQGQPGETLEYIPQAGGSHSLTLVATSPQGCSDTLTASGAFYVSAPVFAAFDLNPHQVSIMQPHIQVVNQSTGYSTLFWDFGDGTTSTLEAVQHTYQNPGEYKVTLVATNEYGCQDDTTALVTVSPDVTLYIPNTFTPGNSDGLNDAFSVKGMGITQFRISIFDRWGEKIFESFDFHFRWDGRYKGESVPQGTYVYRVEAVDIYNQHHDFHGTINIVY
ncbi:MAG: PKD domain-containing protein [Flavobacteriales bacterium]|nr:PKD domain-containing protein [Flavobacteriales bacterium]